MPGSRISFRLVTGFKGTVSIFTYPLSIIDATSDAYVDGRPIPFFSNSRTSVASLYLDGNYAYFCSPVIDDQ